MWIENYIESVFGELMMGFEEQLKKRQFVVWYASGNKSVFNSDCPELVQSKPIVTVEAAVKVAEEYCVSKAELEKLLNDFPDEQKANMMLNSQWKWFVLHLKEELEGLLKK